MNYPNVMREYDTLVAAMRGQSISRFGDGELRVTVGGRCYGHREVHLKACQELKSILSKPVDGLLPCVPRYGHGPKAQNWERYASPNFLRLYGPMTFGSAFITRPDSAPSINTPTYWGAVRLLWKGRDVTLVAGTERSLTHDMLHDARSVRMIDAPADGAYAKIDEIEERIGVPGHTVILCLGVTATILAWRLAKKGVHALDLGHIGMFMRKLEGQDVQQG